MPVLRSYQCSVHGQFDAWEAECPHCDRKVVQVFTKAFAIKSGRTKQADETLKGLAKDFKMTNIKSTREGEYQTGYHTRNNKTPARGQEAAENSVLWGGGGRFDMGSALAGKAVSSVKGEPVGFNPKDLGNLTGPRTASYQADHENLQIKK